MRYGYAVLLFSAAVAGFGQAPGAGPGPPADEGTGVLTDGVDIDRMAMEANSPDPAVSSPAIKALEGIRNRNPTGKRRLAAGSVLLDAPSWQWDYNRKLGIRGIAVDWRAPPGGGDMASILVDRLPGMSDAVVGNVVGELPQGARVTKTELKAFGPFTGTGSREIVTVGGPAPHRMECVLFYPRNKLDGYYIFTVFAGPPDGDKVEAELAGIAESIRVR